MRDETIDFNEATREALDYAARFCPACGSGDTLCAAHRDDRFREDFTERLVDEIVYQLPDDRRGRSLNLLEHVEDALLEAIDDVRFNFDDIAKRTLKSTITKTLKRFQGGSW